MADKKLLKLAEDCARRAKTLADKARLEAAKKDPATDLVCALSAASLAEAVASHSLAAIAVPDCIRNQRRRRKAIEALLKTIGDWQWNF